MSSNRLSIDILSTFNLLLLALVTSMPSSLFAAGPGDKGPPVETWQKDFNLQPDQMTATGRNPYYILEPGYQVVLESKESRVTITVLNETRAFDGVETRVVEEREEEDGALAEVSKNFFALSKETKDLFYFGEEVDVYKKGKIVGHAGTWLAGQNGAKAGMFLPGKPVAGMRFYMEQAPGVALDRAEILDVAATLKTPAGTFTGCLKVQETNELKPKENEIKPYAPGIGPIQDEDLVLVKYGFVSGNK